jgi:putative iron-regulated protein
MAEYRDFGLPHAVVFVIGRCDTTVMKLRYRRPMYQRPSAGRPLSVALSIFAFLLPLAVPALAAPAPSKPEVIAHYADLAEAMYGDAASGARALQTSVNALIAHPTSQTLEAARAAWKEARIPYLQTEGFRFANTVVDDWEPRVNAWPLDEGLIDYVAPAYGTTSDQNPLYTLNVIGNTKLRIGAKIVDATTVDGALLMKLQQAEGVQTNVSTGYHAIEFLLWGQNLKGLSGGQGERPASDYDVTACTHGNCARRVAYLKAATDMLVADLTDMTADWHAGGKARAELLAKDSDGGLAEILTGLGSLSFGEMAGERMKLGLMLHDPEEQQDCFSNNTHNSHYYDEIGVGELWRGRYVSKDGKVIEGASLRGYALAVDPASAQRLDKALDDSLATIKKMKDAADSGRMAYSQMIAADNADGNKLVSDSMDSLVAQTRAIEGVGTALHLKIASNKSDHNSGVMGTH